MYGKIVQRLLEAEMDNHLGYNKSSRDKKKTIIEEMDIQVKEKR